MDNLDEISHHMDDGGSIVTRRSLNTVPVSDHSIIDRCIGLHFALVEALGVTLIYSRATKPNALHSEAEVVEPRSTAYCCSIYSVTFRLRSFAVISSRPPPNFPSSGSESSFVPQYIDAGCMIAVELA